MAPVKFPLPYVGLFIMFCCAYARAAETCGDSTTVCDVGTSCCQTTGSLTWSCCVDSSSGGGIDEAYIATTEEGVAIYAPSGQDVTFARGAETLKVSEIVDSSKFVTMFEEKIKTMNIPTTYATIAALNSESTTRESAVNALTRDKANVTYVASMKNTIEGSLATLEDETIPNTYARKDNVHTKTEVEGLLSSLLSVDVAAMFVNNTYFKKRTDMLSDKIEASETKAELTYATLETLDLTEKSLQSDVRAAADVASKAATLLDLNSLAGVVQGNTEAISDVQNDLSSYVTTHLFNQALAALEGNLEGEDGNLDQRISAVAGDLGAVASDLNSYKAIVASTYATASQVDGLTTTLGALSNKVSSLEDDALTLTDVGTAGYIKEPLVTSKLSVYTPLSSFNPVAALLNKVADCGAIGMTFDGNSCVPGTAGNPSTCDDVTSSGVYKLGFIGGKEAYCEVDGSIKWTWMQNRRGSDGESFFYNTWNDYKVGFGNPAGNHWLGLEAVHKLTTAKAMVLRVELEQLNSPTLRGYSDWTTFSIGNEGSKYKLTVGGFSDRSGGFVGDSLAYHNNRRFSTRDQDNDDYIAKCTDSYGAWWYGACHHSNLNGDWGVYSTRGPCWRYYNGGNGHSVAFKTRMKFRTK